MNLTPKKQLALTICAVCLIAAGCVGAVTMAAGLYRNHVSRPGTQFVMDGVDRSTADKQYISDIYAEPSYLNDDRPVNNVQAAVRTINAATTVIYEYVDLSSGVIERSLERVPYFLIGLTEEDIKSAFSGWTVIDFDGDTLILRQYIEPEKIDTANVPLYIVGIYGGYVAVFYGCTLNGVVLYEVTGTSVAGFPEAEIRRLTEGIHVNCDDELINVLQDYRS